jgi:osmotically-inducible protein OsmY
MREIEWQPEITSKEISVTVHNHVVTLSGFAHGYTEKLAAETVSKRVYGVADVLNHLEVKLAIVKTDPDLAREAVQALQRNFTVPDTRIEVSVKDGEVLLEGSVDWHFQRDAAEASVRDLAGVKSVLNKIVVGAKAPAQDVRTKIEEALRRHAVVDARRVVVLSHNGTVELRGHVRSWTEKEEAASVAWAAPGVTQVENNISVTP